MRLAVGVFVGLRAGGWFAKALVGAGNPLGFHVVAGASGGFLAGAIIGGLLAGLSRLRNTR